MIDGHPVPDTDELEDTSALESLTIRELVVELSRIEDLTAEDLTARVRTPPEDIRATHVASEREPLIIRELRKRASALDSPRPEESIDQKAPAWES